MRKLMIGRDVRMVRIREGSNIVDGWRRLAKRVSMRFFETSLVKGQRDYTRES